VGGRIFCGIGMTFCLIDGSCTGVAGRVAGRVAGAGTIVLADWLNALANFLSSAGIFDVESGLMTGGAGEISTTGALGDGLNPVRLNGCMDV
jgi:hypothetical protein